MGEVEGETAEVGGVGDGPTPLDIARNPANAGGVIQSVIHSGRDADDARTRLVRALADALSEAMGTGDLATARVAHRALGDLISQTSVGDKATVLDLELIRRDRDGKREEKQ